MADIFKKIFKKDKKEKEDKNSKFRNEKEAPEDSHSNAQQQHQQEKVTKEDFESLDILGKGSFAHVVLARQISTGNYYAMKVVQKQGLLDHKRVQDVFTERNVLTRSNHPYLLKLHYTFQSEHKLFFVMDYMPGGDLDKYMNSQPNKMLDPETSRLYAAEIFLAITYLHEHGVIYRDLKPENILLNREGHCALADFGLSKDFYREGQDRAEEMRANSFVGSPFYVAPDVLKQKEYTSAVDFWSFGILLYRMLCGRPPFNGRNMKEVFDNILFSELRFPSASVIVAPEAKDLISRLLIKDASQRVKAPEVRNHPFWTGLDFKAVYDRKVRPLNWKVLPTVEEGLSAKAQTCNIPTHPQSSSSTQEAVKQPAQVVNTPATASQLQPGQQQMFQGFSHTADSFLARH